ncbi:THAP domain-containing protein 5-like [Engystomops pustulosus]|uniref:THAP domain-containing protein 5-like n=1 Tax=Engystomops pustulosus TaxID=76066 RepID=UPI003AFB33B4
MPKSCVVPECRRAETGRESYYKFPLHDKVRLKQWLTNMNMENFFPTKNQYLCNKHFKASCFQTRWGVRYLRHDAVPTVFCPSPVLSNKVQATKSRTLNSPQNLGNEVCISTVAPLIIGETQVLPDTLTIALDPNTPNSGHISIGGADPSAVIGAVNLVPLVHFVESFDGLSLALAPSQGFQSVAVPIEVSGQNQIQQIPLVEPIGFLSEEHIATTSLQQNYYNGQVLQSVGAEIPTIIEITAEPNPGDLVMENISIEPFFEAGLPTPPPATMTTEDVMSYLETMQTATLVPVVSSGPLPPMIPSQETILSSSTDRPIASTVPIISRHSEEGASAGGAEELSIEPSQVPGEATETLSTAELVSVVVNLQNKVTALQQRHQKHCSKLEVMEGVMDQLKKENLISEENLNFLELACTNSTPIQTEGPETITIVCDDEDQALLYALPLQGENRTILHITEQ